MDKFTISKDGYPVQRVATPEEVKFHLSLWREGWPNSTFTVDVFED